MLVLALCFIPFSFLHSEEFDAIELELAYKYNAHLLIKKHHIKIGVLLNSKTFG